jgi:DNA-binding IclR family transcriptional regulator
MNSVGGVGVIDKVMTVIEAVRASGSLSLLDLVDVTGIPRATAHRLATALEQHGMLRRDDLGCYHLGATFVALGQAAERDFPLSSRTRPIAETLQRTTREGVQFYVKEGNMRRCLVSVEASHGLRWIVPEGSLLPLSKGSAGHILSGAKIGSALCISGPLERMTRKPGAKYGKKLLASAAELQRQIGI